MHRRAPRRSRQHGGVTLLLIVVLILLAALVGALAVRGSFSELRMSGSERVSRTSFYCAEAGLNAARPTVGAAYLTWSSMLAGTVQGGVSNPFTGSIAGGLGTGSDYKVWIIDNQDEAPLADNPKVDNDLTVVMISVCTSPTYNATTSTDMGGRELREIVTYGSPLPNDYRNQAGHSSMHSGNAN